MKLPKFLVKKITNVAANDNFIRQEVINKAPESEIRVEMVKRHGTPSNAPSNLIESKAKFFVPKKIEDWNNAIASATDPERPNFMDLEELYDNLLLDSHLLSVIESRIMLVTSSKWDLLDANGDPQNDHKKLFEKPWFETFVYQTVMSKFTGHKVLELFDTDVNGELIRCTSIPMGHIIPNKQEISKEAGGEKGTSYVSGSYANYYVEIDNNGDLGLLSQVATYILAKKQAMGAWLDYLYKYGVPPLIIKTDNWDQKRQEKLLAMGIEMHNNHVMVLQGNEQYEIGDTPQGNSTAIFKEFLDFLNSEISKAFLGQDGTTQNKENAGTYGSLKIMQGVTDNRHESDKLFVKYIINKELIPRLPKINSAYAPIANLEFDWDESDELEQTDYVESAIKFAEAGFELDLDEVSKRSGITLKGYTRPTNDPNEETDDKGGTKKKSPITPSK